MQIDKKPHSRVARGLSKPKHQTGRNTLKLLKKRLKRQAKGPQGPLAQSSAAACRKRSTFRQLTKRSCRKQAAGEHSYAAFEFHSTHSSES